MIEKVIEKWMTETVKDDSWKTHNDIHIDDISSKFKEPDTWINGGIECLKKAIAIRDNFKFHFVIELFVELQSDKFPIGINFTNPRDLINEFRDTPPSLYIFEENYGGWLDNIRKNKEVVLKKFNLPDVKCYYSEILKDDDPDHYRSISFISLPK